MYNYKDVYNNCKNLDVLYVEDDIDVLVTTQSILKNFFSFVTTAVDGEDGLVKYLEQKSENSKFYDLVITDINMPKKNGVEMMKEMRVINPNQIVIVISAYNDSERLLELIEEGISNFITKPIVPKKLMEILYKTSEIINNEKIKDEFLIQQSKLASMGEMVDTIAHQWLGPISLIKMYSQAIEADIDMGLFNKDDVKECAQKQSLQINHIVDTLSEFRTFFRPTQELKKTTYNEVVQSTLFLLKDKLVLNQLVVDVNISDSIEIEVNSNEFKHVLINIISNAIDEFVNKKILSPKLVINGYEKDGNAILEIIDNAGGIPEDIIENIFKANFTTKSNSNGTGMGLYLVYQILQKINAKILVENVNNGVKFIIILKK